MTFRMFEYADDYRSLKKMWEQPFPSADDAVAWCIKQRKLGLLYSVCRIPIERM